MSTKLVKRATRWVVMLNRSAAAAAVNSPSGLAVPLWEAIITCAVLGSIILLTLFGNILVILSVFTYKPLRQVQNFLIVSLAVADICVAVLVLPLNVVNHIAGRWLLPGEICDAWLTFDILFCTASILNLCAIALDRYWAIHSPVSYSSKRTLNTVLLMVACVYLLSAAISIPPLFGWRAPRNNTSICRLTDQRGYVIFSAAGSFFIPAFLMSAVYLNVFLAMRMRLRKRAQNSAQSALTTTSMKTRSHRHCHSMVTTAQEPLMNRKSSSKEKNSSHSMSRNTNVDITNEMKSPTFTNRNTCSNNDTDHQNACSGQPHSSSCSYSEESPQLPLENDEDEVDNDNEEEEEEGTENEKEKFQENNRQSSIATAGHQTVSVTGFMARRQKISLSKERRAARTLGIIMGTFVACWLPFFLMYVAVPFCGPTCAATLENDPRLENFIVWLGYVNSAINPIIYTVFNLDFRRAFQRLLRIQPKTRHMI